MVQILRLPCDLIWLLAQNWISLEALCVMDTAICNKVDRVSFHHVVSVTSQREMNGRFYLTSIKVTSAMCDLCDERYPISINNCGLQVPEILNHLVNTKSLWKVLLWRPDLSLHQASVRNVQRIGKFRWVGFVLESTQKSTKYWAEWFW